MHCQKYDAKPNEPETKEAKHDLYTRMWPYVIIRTFVASAVDMLPPSWSSTHIPSTRREEDWLKSS